MKAVIDSAATQSALLCTGRTSVGAGIELEGGGDGEADAPEQTISNETFFDEIVDPELSGRIGDARICTKLSAGFVALAETVRLWLAVKLPEVDIFAASGAVVVCTPLTCCTNWYEKLVPDEPETVPRN